MAVVNIARLLMLTFFTVLQRPTAIADSEETATIGCHFYICTNVCSKSVSKSNNGLPQPPSVCFACSSLCGTLYLVAGSASHVHCQHSK